jgi:poly(3-hydroxybutyrate) depolymerase
MRAPAPSGEAADSISPLFAGADQPARRAFGISAITVQSETVPVVTRDVAATPFHTLVEFKRSDIRAPSKILVVPPLSGHFAVLLRDLVIGLLADFCVHVIDWTNVRHVPLRNGQFGLDDNIAAVVAAIRGAGPGVSVVGVCQGGVAALAAASLLAAAEERDDPVALILIGAPIDPLANPTGVVRLIRDRPIPWLVAGAISPVSETHAGRGRLVYPAERQLAALLAYLARHLDAGGELFAKLRHDDGADPRRFPFFDLYSSIMDLDAKHFVENIDRVFHAGALAQGALRCSGERVDLSAIRRTALVTIEGEQDDIAAPGQTSAAHALCSGLPANLQRQVVVAGAGHFSLFHGDVFRRAVLPVIRDACRPSVARDDREHAPMVCKRSLRPADSSRR